MNRIPYHIISTGSQGNAVVLNNNVLIDCGVSFKAVSPFLKKIQLVLLTHRHTDHFNKAAIRLIAQERPAVRFGCGGWLAAPLMECGVEKYRIDILDSDHSYDYGICRVTPVSLVHNVPNCGYKVHFPAGKVFYATDTNNLNGIMAKNYDLYLVEANYEDAEIEERIQRKKEAGEYVYELQAMKNHLSKAKCDDFIYKNIGVLGEYVYMHCHKETPVLEDGKRGAEGDCQRIYKGI